MTRGHRRTPLAPISLHIDEVKEAVARKRVTKTREAFRRLVHWPRAGTIDSMASSDDAMAILQATAGALVRQHDTRVMPYETMALLERIAVEQGEVIVGGWYATGAMFVLTRLEHWRVIYQRTLSTEE